MKQKQKVKMARKMCSAKERKGGTALFQTEAWFIRKKVRRIKEVNKKEYKEKHVSRKN